MPNAGNYGSGNLKPAPTDQVHCVARSRGIRGRYVVRGQIAGDGPPPNALGSNPTSDAPNGNVRRHRPRRLRRDAAVAHRLVREVLEHEFVLAREPGRGALRGVTLVLGAHEASLP